MHEKYGYNIVGNLLDELTVKHILSLRMAVVNEGNISEFWIGADGEIFYYSKLNCVEGDDDDDYSLYALAEYLTLIPYGEEGYKVFEDYIQSEEGISACEWRYNIFLKILGDNLQKLTEAGRASIKKFFYNRNLKEVHYNDLSEAAAGIFRLRHKAEAVAATDKRYGSYVGSPKDWDDTFSRLADELPEKEVITMEELLSCFPDPRPLNDEEKEFVKAAKERMEKAL